MATVLEQRLNDLIHEIKEIKKQVVWKKSIEANQVAKRAQRWKILRDNVTLKWKGPSPVEEIRKQREKTC
jgi:hypothetical protein